MIFKPLHSLCLVSLLLSAFLLVACGEETESIRVTERYTLDMLGKGVSLTEETCDSARVGQLLYVGDSSSIYYCTGRVWKKVNGTDGRDGRDGADGADGADGKRGRYGTSGTDCFVDKFTDGFVLGCGATKAIIHYDFEIPDTCSIELDEDSSYVLRCGDEKAKLRQGAQGDAGDICKQTDIGGGQVRLVCGSDSVTTYKAQCGETPFDPDGSLFCYGDTLVERCNTHAYDIKKQFCYGDSLVDMCGGKTYDLMEQFCYNDSLIDLCNGKDYDLAQQFCYGDSLIDLCGGKDYNLAQQFCYNDSLVDLCGGKDYNLAQQFCYSDSLVDLCSGKSYDLKKQFCYNDSLIDFCSDEDYDLTRQFCYGDSLIDLCNGKDYDLAQQFCWNDSLVNLCGGKDYDLKKQFCYSDSIVSLCEGKTYNLKQQFCYNDSLVDLCGGKKYTPTSQFCYNDSIATRCNGETYNLKQKFCYNDSLIDLCGGGKYTPTSQFCYNDSIVTRCNGETYNPKKKFCYNDSLVDLCGGRKYDIESQFCFNGVINPLCGGEKYLADWFLCYDDEIIPIECNGEQYDFEQKFCYNDSLVDRCGGKTYDLKQKFCYNKELLDLCGGKQFEPDSQYCENDVVYGVCHAKQPFMYNMNTHFCDNRNEKLYRYTVIGGVAWMAENLDYKVPGSFCDSVHKDNDEYCGIKGRFYPWNVAMARSWDECGLGNWCSHLHYPHQGVCPDGWHLPTLEEWNALRDVMGMDDIVYWDEEVLVRGARGRNEFGFSAIPTGIVNVKWNGAKFVRAATNGSDGNSTIWSDGFDAWSSTEASADKAYPCYFYTNNGYSGQVRMESPYSKESTRTVRCVRD